MAPRATCPRTRTLIRLPSPAPETFNPFRTDKTPSLQGQQMAADVANYAIGGAVVIHYPVQDGTG